MPFLTTGFSPLALAQWLESLRALVLARVPGAQVADQRYILARVLLIFAEELNRADSSFALALSMLDPEEAEGYWLRLIALRLNVPAIPGSRSTAVAEIKAIPGTVFAGGEEAADGSTGLRWIVGPGTVGVTGVAYLTITALVDGPNTASSVAADWSIKADLPAWTSIRLDSMTELGRLAETEDALRVRVLDALGSSTATEYGDIAAFQKLALVPGESALLGYKTNRQDVPDDNGIPSHHLEVVLRPGLPPEQIGATIRRSISSTAGTWGNRGVTIPGPYGPLDYRYSEGEPLRMYARITAHTAGAQGKLPGDLAEQLAAGLSAWASTLGSGVSPTAPDAEAYLTSLLSKPLPVTDLEVQFSLDNVTFYSVLPVTIRQEPSASNAQSAPQIIGNVAGPYAGLAGEVLGIDAGSGSVGVSFTTETTIDEVVANVLSYQIDGLYVGKTSNDPSATLVLAATATGLSASLSIPFATASVCAILGLPVVLPYIVSGLDTDITVAILP